MTALPTWPEDARLPEEPMLRVVRGQADDDEIAALVTALVAATAVSAPAPQALEGTAPASEWARPLRTTGAPASRGGWRRSGLPAHRTW